MSLIIPSKDMEVRKSEALLRARYQLGELAIKLVSIIYSNVKRSDEVGKEYQIKVSDIAKLMNKNYGEMYNLLKEATDELLENPIRIEDKEKKRWVMFNWIADALYQDGVISFTISKRLKPYILELQQKYLKYRLENILNLRGTYVIRLYEILKDILELNLRYGNKAEKIVSVNELREILEIPKSYPWGGSSGIRSRILDKAKQQLEAHTDIIFEYEEIKTGRKVTHLKFIIRPNPAKLQTDNRTQQNYFKNRITFVALLRKNYSGNGKFFGFKMVDGVNYWLGLDKQGLVYGWNKDDIKDFNAVESAGVYDIWLKIAQNSDIYKQLVEQSVDLRELANNNKELWLELKEDIIMLKEQGII